MEENGHEKSIKEKTQKALLWVGIISIIMMFAGLTSAYIVSQSKGDWKKFELPVEFSVSTAILLISSLTLNMALQAIKQNKLDHSKNMLIATYLLGWAFVFTQFKAWGALVKQGVFLVGNASGSYLYMLSGLHLVHVLGGLIFLTVLLAQSFLKRYGSHNHFPMQLCATYWHFVDILWVYLFLFLLFIR